MVEDDELLDVDVLLDVVEVEDVDDELVVLVLDVEVVVVVAPQQWPWLPKSEPTTAPMKCPVRSFFPPRLRRPPIAHTSRV